MDMPANDMSEVKIGLAADPRQLDKLRKLGAGDKKAQAQALKEAAQQFEHMFMERWYNAMRQSNETINPDSPLHSKYSAIFEDMLASQQIAGGSGKGGFSRNSITYLIAKQFSKTLGDEGKALMKELTSGSRPTGPADGYVSYYGSRNLATYHSPAIRVQQQTAAVSQAAATTPADLPDSGSMRDFASPEDFVSKMMPYARAAVEGLGFNPLVIVAQAALETGWGRHIPAGNNYFGIKAGKSWQGESESLKSPEFTGGKFVTEVSKFRKYPGVLESMKDYVSFITGNQRYSKAVDKSFDPDAYFDEIQKAGYATDPNYAAKLKNISRQIAFMAQN